MRHVSRRCLSRFLRRRAGVCLEIIASSLHAFCLRLSPLALICVVWVARQRQRCDVRTCAARPGIPTTRATRARCRADEYDRFRALLLSARKVLFESGAPNKSSNEILAFLFSLKEISIAECFRSSFCRLTGLLGVFRLNSRQAWMINKTKRSAPNCSSLPLIKVSFFLNLSFTGPCKSSLLTKALIMLFKYFAAKF